MEARAVGGAVLADADDGCRVCCSPCSKVDTVELRYHSTQITLNCNMSETESVKAG
jgi:hypothetical protein